MQRKKNEMCGEHPGGMKFEDVRKETMFLPGTRGGTIQSPVSPPVNLWTSY
jgi:hypothetical protein